MSYKPLHQKYRPETFDSLVGQEAITTTLKNAITSGKIAPAYLFTGPRGTGKTSSARILAKSLNCQSVNVPTTNPCGQCSVCQGISRGNCLDVIEIDAASNTGVDNIREIIEGAQFGCVECRYKVYVIDECHMLSTAAFNALLKTLEEPPKKVVFILATTDPQRVLPTVISRCQRFDYRRIALEAMINHLRDISITEQININDEALKIVAQIANGGLRDAQSMLDQLSLLSGEIIPERVWDLVGIVSEDDLLKLIIAIAENNPEELIEQCRSILNRGKEPLTVVQNLANFYVNLLLGNAAPNRLDLVQVTQKTWEKLALIARNWGMARILQGQQSLKESEVQIKNSTTPRLWLEITLLGLMNPAPPSNATVPTSHSLIEPSKSVIPTLVPNHSNGSAQNLPVSEPEAKISNFPQLQSLKSETTAKTNPVVPENLEDQGKIWQEVLALVQPNSTQSLLKQHCTLLSLEGNYAVIAVKSNRLLEMVAQRLNSIENAFKQMYGVRINVNLIEKKNEPLVVTQISPPPVVSSGASKPPVKQNQETSSFKQSTPPRSTQKVAEAQVNTKKSPNIAENDLFKVAETLAKIFDGEIIGELNPSKPELEIDKSKEGSL